jgi:hypothetical protein
MRALWIIVVILLLGASFVPIFEKQVPYTERIEYEDTEPYEAPINYVVDRAYLDDASAGFLNYATASYVIIRNTDDVGGTFYVTHELYTINGLFGSKQQQSYIGPGNSYTFKAVFDTKWGQDVKGEYRVQPPTKTAYRVVTKYRSETRYKTKPVSLIELVFG